MDINELNCKIDEFLSEKKYDKLNMLLKEPENSQYAGNDYRIYTIRILSEINDFETKKGIKKGILCDRTADEAIAIYREMVLLLRRLEFNLPEEYQYEIIPYVLNKNISAEAIWGIIQANMHLRAKDVIIQRLQNIMHK